MKVPTFLQGPLDFAKELFTNYNEDDAFTLGASLAYYTVFSFAPMLVIILSISSYVLGPEAVEGQMYRQLSDLLGTETAKTLQDIVRNAYVSDRGLLATSIGIGTLLLGATGVFNALKSSLNHVWEIEPRPSNTILGFIVSRLLSFSFVIGLGFLLIVTLVINAVISGLGDQLVLWLPGINEVLLRLVSSVVGLLITTVVFALLFKILPDAEVRWRYAWIGALFTSLLFALGKFLIGLYIGNSDFGSTYGAAAALITLLIWTYYNSQILFLGAEFTYVWAKRAGHPIRPSADAVKIVRQVRKVEV